MPFPEYIIEEEMARVTESLRRGSTGGRRSLLFCGLVSCLILISKIDKALIYAKDNAFTAQNKIKELEFQTKNKKWNVYNLHSMERFLRDPKT